MIHLTKGQPLFENPAMVIYDNTGHYDDGATILCAMVYAPDEPVCRYEAKFVAFGSMVYNIAEPEKLLEEIRKIDPETLFGKNNGQVNADKIVEKIQMSESQDAVPESNEEKDDDSDEAVEVDVVENNATSTEAIVNSDDQNIPSSEEVLGTATSTVSTSSTTPTGIEDSQPALTPSDVTPQVEEIVPVIENVIEELSNVSEVIEKVVDTTAEVSPTN